MVVHVVDMESRDWVTKCGLFLLDVARVANRAEDGTCIDCRHPR